MIASGFKVRRGIYRTLVKRLGVAPVDDEDKSLMERPMDSWDTPAHMAMERLVSISKTEAPRFRALAVLDSRVPGESHENGQELAPPNFRL